LLFILPVAPQAFGQADLAMQFAGSAAIGSAGLTQLSPGGVATFRAQVTNLGPLVGQSLVITLAFPLKTTLFGPIDVFTHGDGSCTSATTAMNLEVTCTQTTLAAADQLVVDLQIRLDLDYPWQNGLTAIATVSSANDPFAANNQGTKTLAVAAPTTVPILGDVARVGLLLCLVATGLLILRLD
jgi:uncharacterized protein DUF11